LNIHKETATTNGDKTLKINHVKKSLIENRIINKNELINIDENNDDGIYIKKRSNKDELKNNSNIQKSNKKFLSSTASANTE
jgi:hypothetical protein